MEELTQISLSDSHICRLCAEENSNGYPLFCQNNEDPDLSALINSYLPIKITDDGKYPRWICPGCHLQVESTVQFFNLVETGQRTLESLCNARQNSDVSKDETYTTEIIDSAYAISHENDHHLSSVDTTTLPLTVNPPSQRKRGRPKKVVAQTEETPSDQNKDNKFQEASAEFPPELSELGRSKREIKIPKRFQGIVQGKELEKVLIENGVVEQSDCDSDIENIIRDVSDEQTSQTTFPTEVIGHLQANDGKNLGYLVVINSRVHNFNRKSKLRKTRFMCDVCKVCFALERKFLEHRFSHHSVKFECKQCLTSFMDRNYLTEHQWETGHEGQGLIEDFQVTSLLATPETNKNDIGDEQHEKDVDITEGSIKISQNIGEEYNELFEEIQDQANNSASTNSSNIRLNNTESGSQELYLECHDNNLKGLSENQTDLNILQTPSTNKSSKLLRYNCNICNHNFVRMSSYIYHRETEHNDRRRFICSKCNKPFRNKAMLQRHQLVHSNSKPFKCKFCDAAFKTKTRLYYHEKTHTGQKEHQCEICQRFFAHKTSLTLHIRSHTGDKPYKCSICGKTFTQHGNMLEHMRIHTGECPFECIICGRRFKTSSQVRMHIKRHEVNKPLKCNICGKTFVQIAELRIHQRRHNNIKPYNCEVCGKSFINLSAVKKHLRLHTGEKPYSCKECPRRFSDPSNLKKHTKIHENKRKAVGFWYNSENPKVSSTEKELESFAASLDKSQNNFTLNGGKDIDLVDESSMWDLIEEDVCFDSSDASNMPADKSSSNSLKLNISYPDLSDTMRSKTLFFVQGPTDEMQGEKVSNLYQTMTLSDISHEDQLVQSTSNVFITNDDRVQNNIQTVILNIQNPLDINLEQACELFRENIEADKTICQLERYQQKAYTSFIDTLDTPD